MSASPVQGRATAKPSLVPDRSTRVRVGRHLPPGNTAHPDRYGRSFMAIGLLIYGDKRCALSPLYASWLKAWKVRCRFYRLQFGAVCGELNKKLVNTMPPKTRNGEGPSKGKASSIQPTLAQNLPPPPPQQRRSGGRSPTVQTQSQSRGVTMLSLRDVPPPEQPHHSHKRTVQGDKSVTKPHEKSARAGSRSHHQASLDQDEDPRLEDIRAQNRLIQEQRELIERLSKARRIRARRPGVRATDKT
ncbi:hypothetical protein AAC387_Pa03g0058 [Persea americana]